MATVTSHTNLTVTTTYLDIPMGGNSPGAPATVPNADGTVGDNTAWLSGTAAAGTYPGALTGFQAVNSSSNEPVSGLRLISVMVTGDTGTTQKFAVNAYDSSLSRIYALINLTNNTDLHSRWRHRHDLDYTNRRLKVTTHAYCDLHWSLPCASGYRP